MNKTLFLASLKANWKLLIGIFLLFLLYQSTMISMYDPENAGAMADLVASLPASISTAFGFNAVSTDLTGHIGTYLYGFIFMVIPLFYIVPVANNLIARHIDRGSMVYLLGAPNTRSKIAMTQAMFLFISFAALMLLSTMMGILISAIMLPGLLDIGNYLLLNLVMISMHLVLCGIAFLASCIFSESRQVIAISAGIPLVFLLLQMMSSFGDKLDALKYLTLFTVIDVQKIFADHAYAWWSSLIMLGVAGLLMFISIRVFDKRSLNI